MLKAAEDRLNLREIVDPAVLRRSLDAIAARHGGASAEARVAVLAEVKRVNAAGRETARAMLFEDGGGTACATRISHLQDVITAALYGAMAAGLMLVYVVLVLLFGSFITPITILVSLPLAVGGAIFALYLYGAGIGLAVVIGFLMLMGIVTKNAIMLVEFAIQAEHEGMSRTQAMIDAGHKRARPIIMTTIAMTAGMIPSALAHGEGGEIRAPMAIAVIGGLLLSTALSLLFVPSLYEVMEGFKERMRRLLVRVLGGEAHLSAGN